MKLDFPLTLYTKGYSIWIKDLNVGAKTAELLKNIEQKLHGIRFDNDLLAMIPKAHAKKEQRHIGPQKNERALCKETGILGRCWWKM